MGNNNRVDTIYVNRTNPVIAKKKVANALENFKKRQRELAGEMGGRPKKRKASVLDQGDTMGLLRARYSKREADETEEFCSEEKVQGRIEGFQRKCEALVKYGHVGTLVVIDHLMDRPGNMYSVDTDVCQECGFVFSFNSVTYMKTCCYCSYSVTSIFFSEDRSQDMNVNKMAATHSGSSTTHPETARKRRSQTGELSTIRDSNSTIEHQNRSKRESQIRQKTAVFRKYLRQFTRDRPKVPAQVMFVLYQELSFVHLMSSVRCRPTPVASILRQKGLRKYADQAVRIASDFNGVELRDVDPETAERLTRRFALVSEAAAETRSNRVITFDTLAAVVLLCENRPDLAELVTTQKTCTPANINQFVLLVLKIAQEKDPSLDWAPFLPLRVRDPEKQP